MTYPVEYFGNFFGIVSIFGTDGTVSITLGAVEMGQGVNTKVYFFFCLLDVLFYYL